MICGYQGCGRYEGGHGLKHHLKSGHNFSISNEQKIIWSYITDSFVHRVPEKTELMKYEAGENSGMGLDQDLLEANVSALLCEQLDMQRKYYETEIETRREKLRHKLLGENSNIQVHQINEDKDKAESKISENKSQIIQLRKQKISMEQKISALKNTLDEENSINKNLELHIDYIEQQEDEVLQSIEHDIEVQTKLLQSFQTKLEEMYRTLE